MKHLILYENFNQEKIELDEKTREEYIKRLEKLISFPELYMNDFDTWTDIISGVPVKYSETDYITKEEYIEYVRKYKEILAKNPGQNVLDGFLIFISGDVPDTDYEEFLGENPIEWWEKELNGFAPEIPYMAKSICDDSLILKIDWDKVK